MVVKICGNWKVVLATRRDNANVVIWKDVLFEKAGYSKRCVIKKGVHSQWVFSIRFAMALIRLFNLAKTALKMVAVIAPEVLKQPLCSVLVPLGTKTAHVWKMQNDSYEPKCLPDALQCCTDNIRCTVKNKTSPSKIQNDSGGPKCLVRAQNS